MKGKPVSGRKSGASLDGLLPGHPDEEWRYLADTLRLGSDDWAVLAGAGLSVGAGLPDWKGLAEGAMKLAGSVMPTNPDASNFPLLLGRCEAVDPLKFWRFVKRKVCRTDAEPTRAQQLLCDLPFELFVTLNYDRLLEEPWARATGHDDSMVMAFPSIEPNRLHSQRLVYLHGRCPGSRKAMTSGSTVLTRDAYYVAYGDQTPLSVAVSSIFMSMNVVIIGSSLADPELAHILNEIGRADMLRDVASRHKRLALVATRNLEYETGLEYEFSGLKHDIQPLFYHSPDMKDHSNLDKVLHSLTRLVTA